MTKSESMFVWAHFGITFNFMYVFFQKKKIIYAYKGYIYTNLVTMEPSSLRQRIYVMLKEATWKGQKNQ